MNPAATDKRRKIMNTLFFYNDETKDFLKGYTPANEHFTSVDEIKEVTENLCLDLALDAEDVRKIRNSVVLFYTELSRSENRSYMAPMQSVTAVCDHYMIHSFGTI